MPYYSKDGLAAQGWVQEMDHTGGWKPSQFNPGLGEMILDRLSQGETIAEVCADPEMPSAATLHRWRHVHRGFGAAYERMPDAQSHYRRLHARLKRERRVEARLVEPKNER